MIKKFILAISTLLILVSCSSYEPTALRNANIMTGAPDSPFAPWDIETTSANALNQLSFEVSVEEDNSEFSEDQPPECFLFGQKNSTRRGVIIGCQSILLKESRDFWSRNEVNGVLVNHQGCQKTNKQVGDNRFFVENESNFIYIDYASGAAYFVPKDYIADGVSIPDWLRDILPGSIFDVIHPKTMAASLVHDRYLCMANHADDWEVNTDFNGGYRSKKQVNDAFRDISMTAGSSAIFSRVARTMVGLFNPQDGTGYEPSTQLTELLELERELDEFGFRKLINESSSARERNQSCQDYEPIYLCLSREKVIINLLLNTNGTEALKENNWFEPMFYLACFAHRDEVQRSIKGISWSANTPSSVPPCNADNYVDDLTNFKANVLGDEVFAFRLGDAIIESAFLLSTESGRHHFVSLVTEMHKFDEMAPVIIRERGAYVQNPDKFFTSIK